MIKVLEKSGFYKAILKDAKITEEEFNAQMKSKGWFLLEDAVAPSLVDDLIRDLEQAYQIRRQIQVKNGVDATTEGTAHHLLADGKSFLDLLERAHLDEYIESFFAGRYVLNAFGGNLNLKNQFTYASKVHRDVRTYTTEMRLLLNSIIMLDDFTLANGATYLLSGSHLKEERPTDEQFFAQADRCTVANRQRCIVHPPGQQALRVKGVDQVNRFVIGRAVERIGAMKH